MPTKQAILIVGPIRESGMMGAGMTAMAEVVELLKGKGDNIHVVYEWTEYQHR